MAVRDDSAVPLEDLYLSMVRMRRVEEALQDLWHRGLVSGEMHLGIGEEAVAAGVTAHLRDGDALALDHRSTPPLVGRGLDVESLVLEMLGSEHGLCGGEGGHMHLLAPDALAASSGIVGASGPLGAGFAFAAQHLRPGAVAVAVFGEGAMNQGMLLESMNLAAAWRLPVVFVCKDSGLAITTVSRSVTAGRLATRARGLGLGVRRVNGAHVDSVSRVAARAVRRARRGGGPSLLIARCHRPDGHFLGDPLLRMLREPLGADSRRILGGLAAAAWRRPGAPPAARAAGLVAVTQSLVGAAAERVSARDPVAIAGRRLADHVRRAAEERATREVAAAVDRALAVSEVAA